jgi:hypothetical protein
LRDLDVMLAGHQVATIGWLMPLGTWGEWVSGVGAFGAVLTSLWLVGLDRRRERLSLAYNVEMPDPVPYLDDMWQVYVVNRNRKPIRDLTVELFRDGHQLDYHHDGQGDQMRSLVCRHRRG